MAGRVAYKSYCWSIGTTSYRTENFNMSIERQLQLLRQFRSLPENKDQKWTSNNDLQTRYYNYLKANDFVKGDAKRPDKDAREKTSGLRDIGLLDDERMLTEAGQVLLNISISQNFESDNFLELSRDSYLYFTQLLKTSNVVDGKIVRPFIVFLHIINEARYLTNDEFTYLLPLCIDEHTTKKITQSIRHSHETRTSDYDSIILSIIMEMDNYKNALALLQAEEISEELICEICMNRKSATYDKPYYKLYQILKGIVFENENLVLEFYEASQKLTNTKVGSAWRQYFFSTTSRSVMLREGLSVLNDIPILKATNLPEFNEEFFKIVHLYKVKATLSDYFDLNHRYFKITDVVIFEDGKVRLDILPECYVEMIAGHLLDIAFTKSEYLTDSVSLGMIGDFLEIDTDKLYQTLGEKIGKGVYSKNTARKAIKEERYVRFNKLIDEKFTPEKLVRMFDYFENRDDELIRKEVTDNADIPTIFEYIIAVAWYRISGRKGDVLEYMNLSLEADLLPRTHAGGGEADIVWQYEESEFYPKHALLIEATLSDKTNQRRMEMEPVSRHLGDYLLENPSTDAYCVFICTYLHINVISDFRGRRNMTYYSTDGTKYVKGMKIMPLQTSELKTLIRFDIKYPQIYKMLDEAYQKEDEPKEWYEEHIVREMPEYE